MYNKGSCQGGAIAHELNHIAVPASVMDTPVEQQPVAHFYTKSKASWFCIGDEAQQYESIPPGCIGEVYERVLTMSRKI